MRAPSSMRADLRTQTPEHNHIDELAARLRDRRWHPHDEIILFFALAKELEDVSRYEESFAYLGRGCAQQRALMRYEVSEDVATLARIVEQHTAAALGLQTGGQLTPARRRRPPSNRRVPRSVCSCSDRWSPRSEGSRTCWRAGDGSSALSRKNSQLVASENYFGSSGEAAFEYKYSRAAGYCR